MGELPCFTRQNIAALMFFQMRPDVSCRIQFWGIGRQAFDGCPTLSRGNVLDNRLGAMGRSAIPNDQHRLVCMALQDFEEIDHLRRLDCSGMNAQRDPPQADGSDHRKALPSKCFTYDRSLAPGSPRPDPERLGAHSGFVDENDQTPFALGFLMAGHLWRFLWLMFTSSPESAGVGC